MRFLRPSYETIQETANARDESTSDVAPAWSSAGKRRKLKIAGALAFASALLGLAAFGSFGERGVDPTKPDGWQEQQPISGETLTAFSRNLTVPEERSSKDGELRTTLRVAPTVSRAGPLAPLLNVRAYEGSVPGPTLRVRPGDRLVLNLVNDLAFPEGSPEGFPGGAGDGGAGAVSSLEGKVEAWPNVTNLHVHGLHVSPAGMGDNIYRRAGPGDALEYVYELPPDHYPGTFYYHPHFEGSSSLQTLGGMSGAIVVEDPEGSLPEELEAMREIVMVLQETNIESGTLRNYKAASRISGSRMPLYGNRQETGETDDAGGDGLLHFVTVNGQYQPIVHAQPGEALRLRLVHGGNNDHMHVSILPSSRDVGDGNTNTPNPSEEYEAPARVRQQGVSDKEEEEKVGVARDDNGDGGGGGGGGGSGGSGGDGGGGGDVDGGGDDDKDGGGGGTEGGCTLLTLARDGVYLEAPRKQGGGAGHVLVAPGSRADLALACDRPGVYRLASSRGGDGVPLPMAYLGKKTDVFEGTLAFVTIGGEAMDMELPTESPSAAGASRLLQDLHGLPDHEVSRFVFEFNEADQVLHLNQAYTWYGINGVQYNRSSVSRRVPLGAVEEWVIVNQRLGRGEGAEGCDSPPRTASSGSTDPGTDGDGGSGSSGSSGSGGGGGGGGGSGGDGDGGGGGGDSVDGGRRTRALRDHRGGKGRRRGLGGNGEGKEACDRAGPGEATADGHPFHLHVNHFQVVGSSWGDEGPDWYVGDWRDTISIPAPGNVTVRWRADDFTGEAVAHCHIFGHSDTGMMMNFQIFDAEG